MTIEIHNETDQNINSDNFISLAEHAIHALSMHPDTDLSVMFVDEEHMAGLHEQWIGEKGTTDVLSFPMDELRPGRPDAITPVGILGDIVICPTVAQEQAIAAGHSFDIEMFTLMIHGMLHLVGYDHATPIEEHEMFSIQDEVLEKFLEKRPDL